MKLIELDAFTTGYVKAALFSSLDESSPNGGLPLDHNYAPSDIHPDTLKKMVEDCAAFQAAHAEDIADDLTNAGRDFWFTRNHHGAGFWDGDWPEDVGERLTEAAHAFGSYDLIIDEGKIYGSPG